MKKIAMFTPLSPQKSGISYFSEDILPYLSTRFDIDIFVDGFKPTKKSIRENYDIYDISEYEKIKNNYEVNIYQIGNNPYHVKILDCAEKYPGIVFLHDYAIHNLYAYKFLVRDKDYESYFKMIGELYGDDIKNDARRRYFNGEKNLWEANPIDFPVNEYLAKNSLGMIVFSQYLKDKIDSYNYNIPVCKTYLYSGEENLELNDNHKANAKADLGFKERDILICSFGFINPTKRPLQLIEAFSRINNKDAKLVFVGDIQESISREFHNKIKEFSSSNRIITTGFTDEKTFKKYLSACDINVSLRYPTMGETSGVVMRGFAYGTPAIVTDIGAFKEIDNEMSVKISYSDDEVNEIYNALDLLVNKSGKRNDMGQRAKKFAECNLTISKTSEGICEFIDEILLIKSMKANAGYNQSIERIADIITELKIDNSELRNKIIERYLDTLEELF